MRTTDSQSPATVSATCAVTVVSVSAPQSAVSTPAALTSIVSPPAPPEMVFTNPSPVSTSACGLPLRFSISMKVSPSLAVPAPRFAVIGAALAL